MNGNLRKASFGRRIGAYMLDSLIIGSIYGIICVIVMVINPLRSMSQLMTDWSYRFLLTAMPILQVMYCNLFEGGKGRSTIGKKATGIIVTNIDGMPARGIDIVTRNMIKVLPMILSMLFYPMIVVMILGTILSLTDIIVCLCNRDHRSLHDLIAGTVILQKNLLVVTSGTTDENRIPPIHITLPKPPFSMPQAQPEHFMQPQPAFAEQPQASIPGNQAFAEQQQFSQNQIMEETVMMTPNTAWRPALLCNSGKYAKQLLSLDHPIIMGRDAQCNLLFDATTPAISRVHCRIENCNGHIFLTDLGSSFGTFLCDGRRLAPNQTVELAVGAWFYIGEKEYFTVQ